MSFYSFYPPAGSGVANPSIGINGAVAPTSSTEVGGINPSGNLEPLHTDASGNLLVSIADTPGAPFDTNLIQVGGAPISEGQKTMANSLPVVIASDQSAIHTIVDSSALPTGAATEAKQDAQIVQETAIAGSTAATAGSVASIDGNTIHVDTDNVTIVSSTLPTGAATAVNQATEIASLASIDSKLTSPLAVTGPLTDAELRATPVPVSGTVTATNSANGATGAAVPAQATQIAGNDAGTLRALSVNATGVLRVETSGQTIGVTQNTIPWTDNISQFGGNPVATGVGVSGAGIPRVTVASDSSIVTLGNVTTAAPSYTTGTTNALSLTTTGGLRVDASGTTQPVSGTVAATQSGTWTVQIGNTANTTPILVKESTSTTVTNSNVAGSATSVTLLASNANRLGATIYNDSTAILYVNLAGNAASTTNYTVQMVSGAYYELPTPHLYTGTITGIWASATGNARVSELS